MKLPSQAWCSSMLLIILAFAVALSVQGISPEGVASVITASGIAVRLVTRRDDAAPVASEPQLAA